MAADSDGIRDVDLDRVIKAVEGSKCRRALGALALDVLSRQAEGRTLFAGEAFVEKRAAAHEVARKEADTAAGNLVGVLERGAKQPLERALVAGFAVAGLEAALADGGSAPRALRFVRQCEWLEVSASYVVFAFVDRLLSEDDALTVWNEVAQAVVDDAAGRYGRGASARARNAARLSALAASKAPGAREALEGVVRTSGMDAPTRRLAAAVAGRLDADGLDGDATVEGAALRARAKPVAEVMRWVSGWALLAWLLRGVASLMGYRHRVALELRGGTIEIRREVSLFGRQIREANETWRLDAILHVGREVRYPSLHLLAGALSTSLGVLLGGLFFFDGVRSGELVLVGVASAFVLGGAGLDLALDVLVPGRRGRVSVEVGSSSRFIRLGGVELAHAERFLRAVRAAASRPRG